jgi:excisionase family DNA binding protein
MQIGFWSNPEKTYKTQQNRHIQALRPVLAVEICSAHQNTLERIWNGGSVLSIGVLLTEEKVEPECRFESGRDMADSREVMNIRQASQYLGVSADTLYKYVNEQKIPAFKLGNRWRFKKSKLDQWMEEQSMETETKGKKKIKAAVKAAGTP